MTINALLIADDLHKDLFVGVSGKVVLAHAGCCPGLGEGDDLRLKSGN
ncbi:hypothetical protein [Nocardia abscessus]|nr:hypothetical protein [Nocardia abscessus]